MQPASKFSRHALRVMPVEEKDSQFRVIVALGNFIYDSNERKKVAHSLGVKNILQSILVDHKSKLNALLQEIYRNM
jgi:hypothetical protein